MITILHAIPTLGGGGAERQLCMLASEQARRGACVHVGIRRGGVHEPVLKKCGVHIHELGNARSINPRLLLALARTIAKVTPTIVQTWLPQMDVVGGGSRRCEAERHGSFRSGRPANTIRKFPRLRACGF